MLVQIDYISFVLDWPSMILEIMIAICFSPLLPSCLELPTKPVPGLLPRNMRHLNNAVQVFKPRIWHQSNHRSLSLSVQYPIIAHCGYDLTGWFSWCHYWKSLSTNLEHWLLLHLYFHIISWQNCPPRYIYTQVTNLQLFS